VAGLAVARKNRILWISHRGTRAYR
jgi:hypothetical protein